MGLLHRLRAMAMRRSRNAKLDDFYRFVAAPCAVLDVGVSNVDHSAQENLFLKTFRFAPHLYTGLGVDDMQALQRQYADRRFVLYDGRIFPFADRTFGAIFSNAVIEHVGTPADQLLFIDEMLRTGQKVYFTTPNKFFPVESHTNVILLHWIAPWFYAWCRRYRSFWTPDNLRLLSHADLQALMRRSKARRFRIQRNRLLGLTMTFSVYCEG